MRSVRLGISVVAAAALVPLTASAALAAPPANDKPGGAIPMTLGQTVNQDTTQATTDARDAKLNEACGAPFTNASVWYSYTPSSDGPFIVDMSQSDYSGGFMIFDGKPTQRSMLNCGPTELGIDGSAGTTYTIMVFSDTAKQGGNLVLSLEQGPPPPKIKVTVDSFGRALSDGRAKLSGTYTCKNADFTDLEGTLTQIWKRVKITGYFEKFVRGGGCDGTAHQWSKKVSSDTGLYAKGEASVFVDTYACGIIDCTEVTTSKTVTLRGPRGLAHPTQTSAAHVAPPASPLGGTPWQRSIRMHSAA